MSNRYHEIKWVNRWAPLVVVALAVMVAASCAEEDELTHSCEDDDECEEGWVCDEVCLPADAVESAGASGATGGDDGDSKGTVDPDDNDDTDQNDEDDNDQNGENDNDQTNEDPNQSSNANDDDYLCTNTCRFAHDGDCDDGGPGADFDLCEYGTDCADCGPRPPRD